MAQVIAPVYCLGADHKTVPLEVLEKLSVAEGELAAFCASLLDRLRPNIPQAELVVLGTCNRFEIYWTEGSFSEIYHGLGDSPETSTVKGGKPAAEGGHAAQTAGPEAGATSRFVAELRQAVATQAGMSDVELSRHMRFSHGRGAVEHLFRVAAGLESLVIGEHQILGQVEQALSLSMAVGAAGQALTAVFTEALRCGRRVRHESAIARNPRSVSTVAVQFAESVLGELSGRRIVLIGSGDMGRLTLKALGHRGLTAVDIVARRIEGARELAARWGGAAHPMQRLGSLLEGADLLIASTASRSSILQAGTVAAVMERRPDRPLVLIDLAVPRDIAPESSAIPGVHLFDLEGLKAVASAGECESRKAMPVAERIIAEQLDSLRSGFGDLAIRPVLSDLWRMGDALRAEVVANARATIKGLDAAQWEEVDRLARVLTNKLLHRPSALLRREATNGRAVEYANIVAELFDLDTGPAAEQR